MKAIFFQMLTVTLKLAVSNHVNLKYESTTQFQANSHGIVDLSKDVPTCGSYQDPDVMSVFWTMKPQEESDKRFWPLKVQNGLECNYEVSSNGTNLASKTINRNFMGSGVQRIEVKTGRVRGTLFLPDSANEPYPAVINIYGGIHKGNVIEDKSAMFASRGIASLALAFFGVPDLPKSYARYYKILEITLNMD